MIKKITKIALIFYFVFNLNIVFGQGENYKWYFGYEAGLDFSSGIPVTLTDGQTHQWEGVATVSDGVGNLLFYSDGVSVWDRMHQFMPNGLFLMGDNSSTQSATIVPFPGNPDLYYIFTCPAFGLSGYFRYSIVDMTLNSGLGDVSTLNSPLHGSSSEKCVAIYKTGSPDVWVIGHNTDTIFYSYLVTSSGISAPVMSYHSTAQCGYSTGYMKASPQGNKIASAIYCPVNSDTIGIYDFDCSSGIVSNEMLISIGNPDGVYALEFSPDGTKLYVVAWMFATSITPIYQYDVTLGSAAAIAASRVTIGHIGHSGVGDAQTGPDNKIYIAKNLQDSLAVINNPNAAGLACGFIENAVYLGGKQSGIGLPSLIRGSVCNTTGIINNESNTDNFMVFPNPCTRQGAIQLTFNTKHNGAVQCEIMNVMGERVWASPLTPLQRRGESYATLDVSFLAKGIYFIKINADGKSMVQKVVKM